MTLLVLIAASGLSLGGYQDLIDFKDYPAWALRDGVSAAVLAELVIDPQGKIVRCEVKQSVGDARLARQICAKTERSKVAPVRNAAGTPSYARVRTVLKLVNPGSDGANEARNSVQSADQVLVASKLPKGIAGTSVDLVLDVDSRGGIVSCEPSADTLNRPVALAACQSRSSLNVEPLVLADGSKPAFVSSMRVRFELEPQSR